MKIDPVTVSLELYVHVAVEYMIMELLDHTSTPNGDPTRPTLPRPFGKCLASTEVIAKPQTGILLQWYFRHAMRALV